MISRTSTNAFLWPKIVKLSTNLYAVVFHLMKLLPAHYILGRARRKGELRPSTVILETTSGTFGLALAMEAAIHHHRLVVVSDAGLDPLIRNQIACLGAEIHIVTRYGAGRGPQVARLEKLNELRAIYSDHFLPSQYNNPDNPHSYRLLAHYLLRVLGRIDCVVGSVGSGGSMCGTVGELRRLAGNDVRAIGVDTPGSVLFGAPEAPRLLRGLGNSVLPRNLDHQTFDEVHWVPAASAFSATRQLLQATALFRGGTSGATYLVGRWWSKQRPDSVTALLFPDEGNRYYDTIYNDEWLASHGSCQVAEQTTPVNVTTPAEIGGDRWSCIDWDRRTLANVICRDSR
jgi:cysteine synthase